MGGAQKKTGGKSRADKLAERLARIKGKKPAVEEPVNVREKIDNMYADAKKESDVSERANKMLQAGLEYKKAGFDAEAEKACNEALAGAENNSETFNNIVSQMTINMIDVKVKVDKPEKLPEDVEISDEERKPELVVGDEDVSDDEVTEFPEDEVVDEDEEETEQANYEEETRAPDEEGAEVRESQIEEEKRLSEVDTTDEAMPPPPPRHEKPEAGEPVEEAVIIDEEEGAQTRIHDEMQELPFDGEVAIRFVDGKVEVVEDEGEATQMWLGELEKGEATEEGFKEKPVTNKDMLKLLKGVDKVVEGLKREIEMLEGEKDELEGKVEILEGEVDVVGKDVYGNMSDVDELEGKVHELDKDLDKVEEVIDDENLKALVRVHVAEELEGKEEKRPAESKGKERTPGEAALTVLDAVRVAPEEGVDGEKYIDALEKCEEEYGEEELKKVLRRLLDIPMEPETAKVVNERVEYVLKEFY